MVCVYDVYTARSCACAWSLWASACAFVCLRRDLVVVELMRALASVRFVFVGCLLGVCERVSLRARNDILRRARAADMTTAASDDRGVFYRTRI